MAHPVISWQAEADSAFTVACGAGEAALVRRLLASRANPEATEALCGAASGGHMEVGEQDLWWTSW